MFKEEPIKFRTTTVRAASKLNQKQLNDKLEELILHNAQALYDALYYCKQHDIGCFRVNSQILPLRTHTTLGYEVGHFARADKIVDAFKKCGQFAQENKIRTTFHPDQFVVLNSPREDVLKSSVAELEYQAEVAEWISADVINIHGGGAYGDKPKAMERFKRSFDRLSSRVRKRLTLENDDRTYTPSELYPLCKALGIPLVYDIHHHRCHQDDWSEEEATIRAQETWDREPLFHISSPLEGWNGPKPHRHHDYIDINDFPAVWLSKELTAEVEAKAKELAIKKLRNELIRKTSKPNRPKK